VIQFGLDHLLGTNPARYGRIGWLTNGSAVTSADLVWGPEAARRAGFDVACLLGPEHGPRSAVREGQRLSDSADEGTGLPIRSLYRPGGEELGAELVDGCDTVVVDLVDNSTRYSTYVATTIQVLQAAAVAGRPVVILDRPNLLGRTRRGPGLTSGARSFVGAVPAPVRHGLTLGELMAWHVRTSGLQMELDVVAVTGWDTAPVPLGHAPYLAPSPNLNCPAAQYLYVGTCLVEGTNLSEGRGTANPFQVVGAPWLDAGALVAALQAEPWPGAAFREVSFVPATSKHAGVVCRGVFVHVLDPVAFDPLALGIRILALAFALSKETALRHADEGRGFLDQLWGSPDLAAYLADGGAARGSFEFDDLDGFDASVAPDLRYGPPATS
jgi:uncharacterized protein YbbC (DUF1343 family)